jgi:hypothetical protein
MLWMPLRLVPLLYVFVCILGSIMGAIESLGKLLLDGKPFENHLPTFMRGLNHRAEEFVRYVGGYGHGK